MSKCNSASLAALAISLALIIGLTFSYTFFFQKGDENYFLKISSEPQIPSFYSVHILTWNVQGEKPNKAILPLLGINSTFKPDFIVVGIQETLVSTINFITQSSSWPDAIGYELFLQDYKLLGLNQNKAMDLMVYVKNEHAKKIEQLEYTTKNKNLMQSKGGLSLRFWLNFKKIAFTNSHLSAGEQDNLKREKEYHEIIDKPFKYSGYFYNHDYHFWFGDLNFRLKHEKTEDALKLINSVKETQDLSIKQNDLKILLFKDQLKNSQKNGLAFSDYEESEINFLPTYKFKKNTNEYDTSRMPSYCDRILTRKLDPLNNNLEIREYSYEAHYDFTNSDHRPVTALFFFKA